MDASYFFRPFLTPPELPHPLIHPHWLESVSVGPAVQILTAGPGTGKTIGLRLLYDAMPADWVRVWVSFEGLEQDAVSLFRTVLMGLQQSVPGFAEGLWARCAKEAFDSPAIWLGILREMQAYGVPTVCFLLDDIHLLSPDGMVWLRGLLEVNARFSNALRVILTSRSQPSLGLARREAQGTARILGPDDLRWGPAEVSQFLSLNQCATSGSDVEALDGWPLGLALWVKGHRPSDALRNLSRGEQAIAAYLAEEIVDACSPALRHLLPRLALLSVITPEAARELCPDGDVDDHLAQLEKGHVVNRVAGDYGYRFPNYLREFLRAELQRSEDPMQVREWHLRLAQGHLRFHHPEESLVHALAAEAWDTAIAAGNECFPAMRYDGRVATIVRRLDAFPPDTSDTMPLWWLWCGHINAHRGDYEAARRAYERGLDLLPVAEPCGLRGKFEAVLANVALNTGDLSSMHAHLERAEGLQGFLSLEDRVDLALVRASVQENEGELLQMRHSNERVLSIPCGRNVEIIASHSIAHRNLFSWAYYQGDVALALKHIEALIAHAIHHRLPAYRLFAEFMQAMLQLESGEPARAEQFFRVLAVDWYEQLDWFDRSLARIALGEWHASSGRWDEAEREIQWARISFEEAGFRPGHWLVLERLGWLYLRRNDLVAVENMLASCPDDWLRNEAPWHTLSMREAALALVVARVWQRRGGFLRSARALGHLADRLEALDARGYAAQACLLQASAWLALGDIEQARAAEQRARSTASKPLASLCPDRAIWLELESLRQAGGGCVTPAETESEMAAPAVLPARDVPAVHHLSIDRFPVQKGLEVRLFGTFEVRIDGVRIDAWPRKRSQHLLQALVLYPRGLARAAVGDAIGETSVVGLRKAWSTLRKVLEPTLDARAESHFLWSDDERYGLLLDTFVYCDVHAFEASVSEASRLEMGDPHAASQKYQEAVRHVRGLLHGGEFFTAEREALMRRARSAWSWLAAYHTKLGDGSTVEKLLQEALIALPDDETLCLALMQHYRHCERHDQVRLTYWDYRKALKTLQGLRPSDEVELFFRECCA